MSEDTGITTETGFQFLETAKLFNYIVNLSQTLLNCNKIELNFEHYESVLIDYIHNADSGPLYLIKYGQDGDADTNIQIYNNLEQFPKDSSSIIVILLKAHEFLHDNSSCEEQISVTTIPTHLEGKENFETIRSLVNYGISPFFDSVTSSTNNDSTIEQTRKKIKELLLSLENLHQTIQIPDLSMSAHPKIIEFVSNGNTSIDQFDPILLSDSSFLNSVQTVMNSWVKLIQNITKLQHQPSKGSTTTEEINFWLSKETALLSIKTQIDSPIVSLTLEILRSAKRFHATVNFLTDTGIEPALEEAKNLNLLYRDLPINDLSSAESLEKINLSIRNIFNHMKKIRIMTFPIDRAISLVETLSNDTTLKLIEEIQKFQLMSLDIDQFVITVNDISNTITEFDNHIKDFISLAREVSRKRSERFISIQVTSHMDDLKDRILYVTELRHKHEDLNSTILRFVEFLNNQSNIISETDFVKNMIQAYDTIKDVNVVDLSPKGSEIWQSSNVVYYQYINNIENEITSILTNLLSNVKTSNEMFGILENFQFLLSRPNIRQALQEFQSQFLIFLHEDIKNLKSQFARQKSSQLVFQLRNIFSFNASMIWVTQMISKLNFILYRVELVLTPEWKKYPEGKKIDAEVSLLQNKLDMQKLYESWLSSVNTAIQDDITQMNVLKVAKNKVTGSLEILTNFDFSVSSLISEVGHLKMLNFDIPRHVFATAETLQHIYPYARRLQESCKTFKITLSALESVGDFKTLLKSQVEEILGIALLLQDAKWEQIFHAHAILDADVSFDVDEVDFLKSILNFEKSVSELVTKTESLKTHRSKMEKYFNALNLKTYNVKELQNSISHIQKLVKELISEGFVVEELLVVVNNTLCNILEKRCKDQLVVLQSEFEAENTNDDSNNYRIVINDSEVRVTPVLESFKVRWISKVTECIGVVVNQKKLTFDSIDRKANDQETDNTFQNLLPKFDQELQTWYDNIDTVYLEAQSFVKSWVKLQDLWDLDISQIVAAFGTNVDNWNRSFQDLYALKSQFDTIEAYKNFKCLVIDYEQAQSRVTSQFTNFQRQLCKEYANVLNSKMKDASDSFKSDISMFGKLPADISNPTLIVQLISFVYKLQNAEIFVKAKLTSFQEGQRHLVKSRFKFDASWIYYEQLAAEYVTIQTLLNKRSAFIDSNEETIRILIKDESLKVQSLAQEITQRWSLEKPVGHSQSFASAMASLDLFEKSINDVKLSMDTLQDAALFLNVAIDCENTLSNCLDEIKDFKSVWTSIGSLSSSFEKLRLMKWNDISPPEIRKELDVILNDSRNVPSRIRQYAAFEEIQSYIKNTIKLIPLISGLRSDAIYNRHWEQIFMKLTGKSYHKKNFTFGDVLDLDLLSNEQYFKSIIQKAQGEKGVEDSIQTIEENWKSNHFELYQYNDRYNLIKGWDALFQCNMDDLNLLSSMKHSPFFANFEKRATKLQEQLDSLHSILDIWIEVQREWVYLNGVFDKNEEIKRLLPIESARFSNSASEFFELIKPAYKSKVVLEVIHIPNILDGLKKISNSLNKIKKSLVGYLERQRDSWPRFYFLGNEDLLEIIGNSSNPMIVINHMRKLFAGASNLKIDHDNKRITSVISVEEEELVLDTPVSFGDVSLMEWLPALELEMKVTVSSKLGKSIAKLTPMFESEFNFVSFLEWIKEFPCQTLLLGLQVQWTHFVEQSIENQDMEEAKKQYTDILDLLTKETVKELDFLTRRKVEILISELLHETHILNKLIASKCKSIDKFVWRSQQRYYYDESVDQVLDRLVISQGNSKFVYGFEYMGAPPKLVNTPLVDKCFLGMSDALNQKLGGSLIGPAGTGKTETIKAMGQSLGRMVLVFCCDETFDFQAVSRILAGICRIGAWACFDEFNRLDENILSSISTQIEKIETALSSGNFSTVDLLGKEIEVHSSTGIFITSNPTYSGRSELPDNLKNKYRTMAVTKPDTIAILQVILASLGFLNPVYLASVIVPFFEELSDSCSIQPHYDFGLRAIKTTAIKCGTLRRSLKYEDEKEVLKLETDIVVTSLFNVVLPKLIPQDEPIFNRSIQRFETDVDILQSNNGLVDMIKKEMSTRGLSITPERLKKALQLFEIQKSHHGFMMVGDSGTGKSTILEVLLGALEKLKNKENLIYRFDPKVLGKKQLFGALDLTTREWTDGVLTRILRKIDSNLRGEKGKLVWIILDGDVDPHWVENLNSVLDDNKLITLPTGERISLSENVKIVFEVQNLKHATPATVSRCGIVWFSSELMDYTSKEKQLFFDFGQSKLNEEEYFNDKLLATGLTVMDLRSKFLTDIQKLFNMDNILAALNMVDVSQHIMEFDPKTALETIICFLKNDFETFVDFISKNPAYAHEEFTPYVARKLMIAITWGFTGDLPLAGRHKFSDYIVELQEFLPYKEDLSESLVYADVSFPKFGWSSYTSKVPIFEMETHMVLQPDVVIPTLDTVRHESIIFSVIKQHRPLILCGPPGSGKTMTLMAALRQSSDYIFAGLNFSKETSTDLIINTLEQHAVYKSTSEGLILTSPTPNKWLVVLCDEINLPSIDKYDTQIAISFLRQLIENKGFWRRKDDQWVTLTNIQFVGACNPPSDPGRNLLSSRFLRHCSVFMIDYPGSHSLSQIYGTFNNAVLKCIPELGVYSENMTRAMVKVYEESSSHFTTDIKPHYVYSPRELTRWTRGIYSAIKPLFSLDIEGLVRIWAHEALRLFSDRLSDQQSRNWTFDMLKQIVKEFFPYVNSSRSLKQPILYSDWLSYEYSPVDDSDLRRFVTERLRVFSEEELDTSIVLFDDSLDHILRIDRVLKNHQGHMILVGPSSSGKTTLSKFVAWMNGITVYQLSTHAGYKLSHFDKTLKDLLVRAGTESEKICFIIDEANILESSFLERMNNILANAEAPGLYEEDELDTILNVCIQKSQEEGLYLDTKDELYKWFTGQIAENFHVIFTFADLNSGDSQITSSPALFNRCVIDWVGDWSFESYKQAASILLNILPTNRITITEDNSEVSVPYGESMLDSIVSSHCEIRDAHFNGPIQDITPGQFISYIDNIKGLYLEKDLYLQELQSHINVGLDKLRDTVIKVKEMKEELSLKKIELATKDEEAKQMLDNMITGQNEAERKQEASIEIQKLLEGQEAELNARRKVVLEQLEEVEPLIIEALNGVKNIKKQHLTELRSLAKPPEAIRTTLEAVCVMLGYEVQSWRDVQMVIRKDDFIASIVGFDSSQHITKELFDYMESNYLSRKDFNFEAVDRASKACGPLLLWVQAQLRYATIADQVAPLREEVYELELQSADNKTKFAAINGMISDLQKSIKQYKESYSEIIRQAERIKSEMFDVQAKVDRSVKLMENLTEERLRWQESTKDFNTQRANIVGDTILAATIMTYCGSYDQKTREEIEKVISKKLTESSIPFNPTLTTVNRLSSSSDLITWEQQFGLPNDDLFFENCSIMLKNFTSKFSFIIDPSNKIIDFLVNYLHPNELTVTSFIDEGYVRLLENCVKFGGSILIQDGEKFDPIINAIINRDVVYSGGRAMVQLGDKKIDISPNFKLYVHTRDSSHEVLPFVSSRMNVLNYTFTTSSLQKQALNITLRYEVPDIEAQRVSLLKAQGENKQKLRELENSLLLAINESQKSLLENDDLVEKLVRIKFDAQSVSEQLANASDILESVENMIELYRPLATAYSFVYELLDSLHLLKPIYQYGSNYAISVLEDLLLIPNKESLKKNERSEHLVCEFFERIYQTTAISILQSHRPVLGMLLFSFYKWNENELFKQPILELMKHYSSDVTGSTNSLRKLMSEDLNKGVSSLTHPFLELVSKSVDQVSNEKNDTQFSNISDTIDDFATTISRHKDSSSPLILRFSEGVDVSLKVESLAKTHKVSVNCLSMGSQESLISANILISNASREGQWVVIENVQFSVDWLDQLHKVLSSLPRVSNKFKLFLTCTLNSVLPQNLERASTTIVIENDPGARMIMKNLIMNSNSEINKDFSSPPIERRHMYFLLSWFHSIALEKLRFLPIGFSKNYGFNGADLYSAKFIIDECISMLLKDRERSNLSPDNIPWDTIRYMIGDVVYGGRVDNTSDLDYLTTLAGHIFTKDAFEFGFNLLNSKNDVLEVPEGRQFDDYKHWIESLPEIEPVEWLGLPPAILKTLGLKDIKRVTHECFEILKKLA